MRLSKQTYYDNASSLSQGDNNIRSAPECSTVGRKVQAVKDWMTDVSVTRVRATTTVCTKCQGWRERRGNICLELLSPAVTLLCAQLQTFIFCLWECSILTICFHSSFCILSASSLPHSLTLSLSLARTHRFVPLPPIRWIRGSWVSWMSHISNLPSLKHLSNYFPSSRVPCW